MALKSYTYGWISFFLGGDFFDLGFLETDAVDVVVAVAPLLSIRESKSKPLTALAVSDISSEFLEDRDDENRLDNSFDTRLVNRLDDLFILP